MLQQLKKVIKLKGMIQVCSELGYRSPNTINNWIKKNKIPNTAIEKVKKYLGN